MNDYFKHAHPKYNTQRLSGANKRSGYKKHQGFSMIELLIGMAVGLVGLTIIASVLAGASTQKKTTSSLSESNVGGVVGTSMLDRDLRLAGYGIANTDMLGKATPVVNPCIFQMSDTISGGTNATRYFSSLPVQVKAGANNQSPDTLLALYSDSDISFSPASSTATYSGSARQLPLDQIFSFRVGSFFAVYNSAVKYSGAANTLLTPSTNAGANANPVCIVHQITSLPVSPANSIQFDPDSSVGNVQDPIGNNISIYANDVLHNISYPSKSSVYSLGYNPRAIRYTVVDNSLTQNNLFGYHYADTQTTLADYPVVDNVVNFKVQFLLDNNADGTVDQYFMPAANANWPTSVADLQKIIAVRYALVVRASQPTSDPDGVPSTCDDGTANALTLFAGTSNPATGAVCQPLTAAQLKYRYRVYTSTVPLRNIVYRPD